MKKILLCAIILSLLACLAMADTAPAQTPVAKTVSIQASSEPVRDVIKKIADTTGETILLEKTVDGKVTMDLKDVTLEKALDAVTKGLHIQWRKLYIDPASPLIKDPDSLVTQMRMVQSVKFPDMMISSDGAGTPLIHAQGDAAVKEINKALPKPASFKAIYVLTNDEKAKKKDLDNSSKSTVDKYTKSYKELLDMFVNMSPEERNAVMSQSMELSMGMMRQMGPDAVRDMMSSIFQADPEYMSEMNKIGMQAIFGMSAEARKAILRSSMKQQIELMNTLSPEQLQEFQQEAAAAAAEVMNQNGANQQQ